MSRSWAIKSLMTSRSKRCLEMRVANFKKLMPRSLNYVPRKQNFLAKLLRSRKKSLKSSARWWKSSQFRSMRTKFSTDRVRTSFVRRLRPSIWSRSAKLSFSFLPNNSTLRQSKSILSKAPYQKRRWRSARFFQRSKLRAKQQKCKSSWESAKIVSSHLLKSDKLYISISWSRSKSWRFTNFETRHFVRTKILLKFKRRGSRTI